MNIETQSVVLWIQAYMSTALEQLVKDAVREIVDSARSQIPLESELTLVDWDEVATALREGL